MTKQAQLSQPLYRLNCHTVHHTIETHNTTCWEPVDITAELNRILTTSVEGDGFSLKYAVEKLGTSAWFAEGDEKAPFFSEAYLYNLLGKEAARTVLGSVRQLLRKLGVPEQGLP